MLIGRVTVGGIACSRGAGDRGLSNPDPPDRLPNTPRPPPRPPPRQRGRVSGASPAAVSNPAVSALSPGSPSSFFPRRCCFDGVFISFVKFIATARGLNTSPSQLFARGILLAVWTSFLMASLSAIWRSPKSRRGHKWSPVQVVKRVLGTALPQAPQRVSPGGEGKGGAQSCCQPRHNGRRRFTRASSVTTHLGLLRWSGSGATLRLRGPSPPVLFPCGALLP